MRFEFERGEDTAGEPSLAEMTAKAIELLARNPRGYVLIVEGGRIDHGHHFGNAFRALGETVEFSNAVRVARALVKQDETLLIVTADHSHVLTMAGYPTRGNDILGLARGNDDHGAPELTPLRDMLGLPFTTLSLRERTRLHRSLGRAARRRQALPAQSHRLRGDPEGAPEAQRRRSA